MNGWIMSSRKGGGRIADKEEVRRKGENERLKDMERCWQKQE